MGSSKKKKRIEAIEEAFQNLPLEQKEELVQLIQTDYLLKKGDKISEISQSPPSDPGGSGGKVLIPTHPSSLSPPVLLALQSQDNSAKSGGKSPASTDLQVAAPPNPPVTIAVQFPVAARSPNRSPVRSPALSPTRFPANFLARSPITVQPVNSATVAIGVSGSSSPTAVPVSSASAAAVSVPVHPDQSPAVAASPVEHDKRETWADLFKDKTEGMHFVQPVEIAGVKMGKIPKACVDSSCKQWESTIICKVLGCQPPLHVMDSFFRRVWRNSEIQKVWFLSSGVFVVKFSEIVAKNKALEKGMLYFQDKPVLLYPWTRDFRFKQPEKLPVWIKLPDLDPIYWTPEILSIIMSPLGVPLKVDTATHTIDKLNFARVQVEIELATVESLPTQVAFMDENDIVQKQNLEYEWLPVKCSHCHLLGHSKPACNKLKKAEVEPSTSKPKAAAAPRPHVKQPETKTAPQHQNKVYVPKLSAPAPPSSEATPSSPVSAHRPGKEPMLTISSSTNLAQVGSNVLHEMIFGTIKDTQPPKPPDGI